MPVVNQVHADNWRAPYQRLSNISTRNADVACGAAKL